MNPDVTYTKLAELIAQHRGWVMPVDPDDNPEFPVGWWAVVDDQAGGVVAVFGDQHAAASYAPGKPSDDEWEEIREHWEALDEWLKKGGFAPKKWDPARNGTAQPKGWELTEDTMVQWTVRRYGKVVCHLQFNGGAVFAAHWEVRAVFDSPLPPAMHGSQFYSPGEAFSRVKDAYEGLS